MQAHFYTRITYRNGELIHEENNVRWQGSVMNTRAEFLEEVNKWNKRSPKPNIYTGLHYLFYAE